MSTKVEPFIVGDFVHVYNRGNNKQPIFLNKTDYWRFMRGLRFFNDKRDIEEFANGLTDLISSQKKEISKRLDLLEKDLSKNLSNGNIGNNTFKWRREWGLQQPLVQIIAYCLMPNHYHLILREITPGGVSKFMKKIGAGYTVYWNLKNKKVGRIFQGQYRGKKIKDEKHLQYLDAYIQLLNPFELFEGGILAAMENFDEAFQFALQYPFCSLGEVYGKKNLQIVQRDCFEDVFPTLGGYREFCKDTLLVRSAREFLGKLTME